MTTESKGKLYLIPTPLGDYPPELVLTPSVLEKVRAIKVYVVEELRSARRFLSACGWKGHVEELQLFTLNEHSTPAEIKSLLNLFGKGEDVGMISEAGLPAVADPGAPLVALCHANDIQVVPLIGPSSLMMALMASGLNGQAFAFNGYLPVKAEERRSALKALEKRSAAEGSTQLFIETPYRSESMLKDILSSCKDNTLVCVAANITLPEEFILTQSVSQWKRSGISLGKVPCVFLLLAR